ncbi:unnamed protein product [Rotaria sp. Silwood2]|nr:unnamed protein product [Rotaria sp. Silwood2]CAF3064045.1 unnamed protein product [Rotaria sp. Silwood2]CAF4610725.1 unnamed protein product [Rotaria sp. Silwood2]
MSQHHVTGVPKYLSFVTNRLLETAVWTFAELGIADHLAAADAPQTAEELAQKQGWNIEYLYRLLRTVADADIVREIISNETIEPEKTNCFELTEDGRFLTSVHPSKARYLICWELSPLLKTASHYLPDLIREGSSKGTGIQRIINNESIFDFLKKEENKKMAHNFNEAMTSLSSYNSQYIVNSVDFDRFNTIVDIGGGLGSLLSHILEKYLTIKQGICFDLPNVIQEKRIETEFEKRNISKDRYQFVAGDMFDAKTIPQADAYIMKCIIHDWNDDRAIDILKAIRTAANGQQITIFIVDLIILPETEQNKFINQTAHAIDIHMMILLDAKERTQTQYEYLCKQSGFRFKHLYHTETPFSIIEAVVN